MVKQADTNKNYAFKAKGKFNKEDNKGKGKFNKEDNKGGIKFVKGEKRRKVVDDNTKNLRRLYNRLMQKNKDNKKDINKVEIINKIMKNINGNYADVCYKHDGCRVLQGSIKYGDKKQRHEIIKNLIPHIYDLIIKKYSIYLAIKIFKYAEQKQREEILAKSILPNFGKLVKTANGQTIFNFIFANSTNSMQNQLLEYYMNKFLKIPESRLKELISHEEGSFVNKDDPTDPSNDVIINEKQGTYDQENIRNDIKAHLEKQLEKGSHKNFVFQAFLNKIFDYLDVKTKVYVAELFDDDLNEFLNNKHGVELSCKIFTVANAKTRKKVIKKIKDNIKSFLSNEQTVIFVIKVILFNDDTKLIEKYLLKALMEQMNEEIMQNKNLFKIFLNILSPFNPRANTQYENKILQYNVDTSSKKDDNKRHEELLNITLDDIFRIVNLNNKFFVSDLLYSSMLVELINILCKHNDDEKLKEILINLVALVEIDYRNNYDDINSTLLANKSTHFVINKLMKYIIADLSKDYKIEFFKGISKILLYNFEGFLNSKAIFLIVTIFENENTKKLLEKDITKFKYLIESKSAEKDMIGFQVLNKIMH